MNRPLLSEQNVAPEALTKITGYHAETVNEVATTVKGNKVVVVGMAHNPFVKKARGILEKNNIAFKYLEYGNYWSQWKPRLAIKLWSGWPTYPQVFVEGNLIGGYQELHAFLKANKLK